MARKIAVITGTRAEYGLLQPVMRELQQCKTDLQVIATGTHLSEPHGLTVRQIEQDGFPINACVELPLAGDSPMDAARAMGTCVVGMASVLAQLAPDIVVVLGDRYEILAAASAAALMRIPVAHIHGGEVTEGALDESMRHAITKLSYWHFPATEAYAARIRQLGENPGHIFATGAPGIDHIAHLPQPDRKVLEKELGIALKPPVLLVSYHPETLSLLAPEKQVAELLAALDEFPEATLLMSGANADAGGQAINARLEAAAAKRDNALFRMSFGSKLYLAAMQQADLIVGNSSSALIEAAAMGRGAVNIGNRQKGRLRAGNIIDCACDAQAIARAIREGLSPAFTEKTTPSTLFGIPGEVSAAIARKLASIAIPAAPVKPFYDI